MSEVIVKKYRRIEITAFRRRVMIVSGDPLDEAVAADVSVNDSESQETIETGSEEGQDILIEAIRLLEETISKNAKFKSTHSPTHDDLNILSK